MRKFKYYDLVILIILFDLSPTFYFSSIKFSYPLYETDNENLHNPYKMDVLNFTWAFSSSRTFTLDEQF